MSCHCMIQMTVKEIVSFSGDNLTGSCGDTAETRSWWVLNPWSTALGSGQIIHDHCCIDEIFSCVATSLASLASLCRNHHLRWELRLVNHCKRMFEGWIKRTCQCVRVSTQIPIKVVLKFDSARSIASVDCLWSESLWANAVCGMTSISQGFKSSQTTKQSKENHCKAKQNTAKK